MSKADELLAALAEANAATTEIAGDIDALIEKVTAPGLSDEETAAVKAEIVALKERLVGVAAKY